MRACFGEYMGGDDAVRLNLGCARNPEPGFTNLDLDTRTSADVVHDLETVPLPFADATFDVILGSHVFEHIRNFLPLVADLYRVLKPGGYLISVTPYLSSDDAWDSPHHVRAFGENTWHYACLDLYERGGLEHAGRGAFQGEEYRPWRVLKTTLVPYEDLVGLGPNAIRSPAELAIKKRFMRNVIKEIHVVLHKAEELHV